MEGYHKDFVVLQASDKAVYYHLSFFINEFAELIENIGIGGVQLFPDDIQVLILLFADYVALISDSIVG